LGYRILAIGQARSPTGYARVLESVLARLVATFDVTLFAVNYRGPGSNRSPTVIPNRVLGDPYGREQLPAILAQHEPDLVLIHHDPYMYAIHRPALAAHRRRFPNCKVVVYCPIDSPTAQHVEIARLADADEVVAYNEFGRGVLEERFRMKGLTPPPLTVIGHGVDMIAFTPLVQDDVAASRRRARSLLFPDRPQLRDAFIVLNANRNGPRKRIDLTLRGFAEFAATRADAYLYLHMGMQDRGKHLGPIVEELGIAGKVLTTTEELGHPRLTDARLNLIYNACDVGLNTATGEGWGLIAFEHGAAGAAQVMPRHTACAELWDGNALFLEPDEEGVVSSEGVATALGRLYQDETLRSVLGRKAHELATSAQFDWDEIASRWTELFDRLGSHFTVGTHS
jgi:D-inositol-3-phosphate glycosyltransferase